MNFLRAYKFSYHGLLTSKRCQIWCVRVELRIGSDFHPDPHTKGKFFIQNFDLDGTCDEELAKLAS